jgi:hypothetical protein
VGASEGSSEQLIAAFNSQLPHVLVAIVLSQVCLLYISLCSVVYGAAIGMASHRPGCSLYSGVPLRVPRPQQYTISMMPS